MAHMQPLAVSQASEQMVCSVQNEIDVHVAAHVVLQQLKP